jgi:hypothetical protein
MTNAEKTPLNMPAKADGAPPILAANTERVPRAWIMIFASATLLTSLVLNLLYNTSVWLLTFQVIALAFNGFSWWCHVRAKREVAAHESN